MNSVADACYVVLKECFGVVSGLWELLKTGWGKMPFVGPDRILVSIIAFRTCPRYLILPYSLASGNKATSSIVFDL